MKESFRPTRAEKSTEAADIESYLGLGKTPEEITAKLGEPKYIGGTPYWPLENENAAIVFGKLDRRDKQSRAYRISHGGIFQFPNGWGQYDVERKDFGIISDESREEIRQDILNFERPRSTKEAEMPNSPGPSKKEERRQRESPAIVHANQVFSSTYAPERRDAIARAYREAIVGLSEDDLKKFRGAIEKRFESEVPEALLQAILNYAEKEVEKNTIVPRSRS